ncbi:cytochrome b N-terminal domain-containing protein [Flavisolibacter ginsenosidimutans]|uniref:C-type cytochrome n=1 Tax=Flavisolibacter ginsenosidimutans TaxID=661481 RepID=A0A5B8UD84_9BACT|nr:cytochrome b N-terminal domain-containing protein [Flavisolibacter ginsenosidimutans]QEC54458.1 c-type cytochrome [Flavisolibacter ginsenosidimutans]
MNPLKKAARWLNDRSGFTEMLKPLLDHPVPPGSKWAYVFGSATLFCFVLQVATGVGLALLYQPSSQEAFQSLQYITYKASLGKTLRGIHYFGASGMIVMVGLHMLRTYITAAYKYPREMSWISGVVLLLLTVGMGFTGQLLRWDDNGVWSAVVAAEQMGRIPLIGKSLARLLLGGDTLGGQSLSRFFSYHVFLIPALLFVFTGFHLWLVMRNGISEPPKAGQLVDPRTYRQWYKNMLRNSGVPFWPYAAWRDALFGSLIIMAIVVLAVVFGPPALTKPPDPSNVITTPQPDWYLLWIYALFALMPAKIESYVMFFGPLLLFFLLFALPFVSNKGERSPIKRPWAIVGSCFVVIVVVSLLFVGKNANWSPNFNAKALTKVSIPATDSLALSGSVLFQQKACLYCHSINNEGGKVGPDLTHVANRLSEEQITIRIANGAKNMPAYGSSLSNDELKKLVAFLKTRN